MEPTQPPLGQAIDLPATAEGLRRRRGRRWLWIVGLWWVIALIVVAARTLPLDSDTSMRWQVQPLVALLVILPVQGAALACGRRERRILGAYSWQCYPCELAGMQVRLRTDAGTVVLTPRMVRRAPRIAASEHPGQAWFCGDLRYGGVLSPVGGREPIRYVRDKRPSKRKQLREPFPGADELAARTGAKGAAY
jgi:hypothetical protein